MAEKTLMAYAAADYHCSCGKQHRTDIRDLIIEDEAVERLPDVVRQQQLACGRAFDPASDRVMLIADENTWQAAGERVEAVLLRTGIKFTQLIFPGKPDLIPDEKATFKVLAEMPAKTGVLISIGSGTLNDLVRFVSYKVEKPYICVATAPSMDGYASSVAPMIQNNLKTTYETWGAAALLAQPDILAGCPDKMLAAGLGDILGKYTALTDWKLGRLVENEYFCESIHELVRDTADTALAHAGQLAERHLSAVQETMEGLLMTGIAMSYAGNSRPASGAEHHLSHFLEMSLMQQAKPPVLHGSKVGLATPMVCDLYLHIQKLKPDFAKARAKASQFDFSGWQQTIEKAYGSGAAEVVALGRKTQKNAPERTVSRINAMEKNWQAIVDTARTDIPDPQALYQALIQVGAPSKPADLGITDAMVYDAVRFAADMRDRFTILQLYADLDLQDEALAVIAKWL